MILEHTLYDNVPFQVPIKMHTNAYPVGFQYSDIKGTKIVLVPVINPNFTSMFRNYLITALRYLIKEKAFSFINIFGLSLGMAFAIIIFLWVQDELSYDKFNLNHDRIYHTYLRVFDVRTSFNFQPTTSPEIGKAMLDEIPGITGMSRMIPLGELTVRAGDNVFMESGGIGADAEVFQMFTYPFVEGDPAQALSGLYSIVLTGRMAKKYFGDEDPVGKSVRINDRIELTVTGVIRDVPLNTHQPFDFLVPFKLCRELGIDIEENGNLYGNCRFYTYVMLAEDADQKEVMRRVTETFRIDDVIRGETFLVPLPKTNRYSQVGGDLLIYIFLIVGVLILLVACINFMNLSTAKATLRMKEVGVRKVFGASKGNLFRQFMGESFIYALISLNFALIMAILFMPVLNKLTGKQIELNYLQPVWIAILFAIWLFTSFTAGAYPSLLLASWSPARIFHQQGSTRSGRSLIRVILVTTQFVFASTFLITALVVNRQFFYMDHADKGYDEKNLLYIRLRDQTRDKSEVIKTALLALPGISGITNTSHLPVLIAGGYYQVWGRSDEELRYLCSSSVDYDYTRTMGIGMAGGRFFSREFPSDSVNAVVLNETAVNTLGWENAVGKQFFYGGDYYTVIGVMKDFHHVPLVMQITPLVFQLHPTGNDYLLVRMPSGDEVSRSQTLDKVEAVWKEVFGDLPIEYNFIDDYHFPQERMINAAERLMWYFTLLTILISSLGLYGLSTFMAERKIREIGIRKVMGAGSAQIVRIFSMEYLRIILLATLIAWPVSWLLMKKFLSAFAYRMELSPWIFVLVGTFICLLALLTVGYQAWRSAVQNPADTLRYE
jgi:putative ABC transport system permease protein